MFEIEHVGVINVDLKSSAIDVEVVQEGVSYFREFWSLYMRVDGFAVHIADRDSLEEIEGFKENIIKSAEDDIKLRQLWVENDNRLDNNLNDVQNDIVEACEDLKEMLLEKNRKYGNSALNPVRIFSKASNVEQILVRLDDKLSRLKNFQVDDDEDVIKDLLGYLILLSVAIKNQK